MNDLDDVRIPCSDLRTIKLGKVLKNFLPHFKDSKEAIFLLKDEYAVISHLPSQNKKLYLFDIKSKKLFQVRKEDIDVVEQKLLNHSQLYLIKFSLNRCGNKEVAPHINEEMLDIDINVILKYICAIYKNMASKVFAFLSNRKSGTPILTNQYARFLFVNLKVSHTDMMSLLKLNDTDNNLKTDIIPLFKCNLQEAQDCIVKLSGGRSYLLGEAHHLNYCITWMMHVYF